MRWGLARRPVPGRAGSSGRPLGRPRNRDGCGRRRQRAVGDSHAPCHLFIWATSRAELVVNRFRAARDALEPWSEIGPGPFLFGKPSRADFRTGVEHHCKFDSAIGPGAVAGKVRIGSPRSALGRRRPAHWDRNMAVRPGCLWNLAPRLCHTLPTSPHLSISEGPFFGDGPRAREEVRWQRLISPPGPVRTSETGPA